MDSLKCPFGDGRHLPLIGVRKVRSPLLSPPRAIFQSLELTVPKIDYKITPYIAEFVNTVTNAFFSKDFGCHEHVLTLVQFPWQCMECEIRSDKSIIRGLLQPSWASCLSELDLGCSMPRSSIRFVPQLPISILINPVPTFRRTSKYVSSCNGPSFLTVIVIWTTCIMVAMVWSWDMSKTVAYSVYAALMFTAIAVTAIYMHIKDPTFHQVAYAALTALVLTRSIYLLHTRVADAKARKNMWWTIMIGVGTFATGFILWIIDNECCDFLRSVRHQIGIPWAFLLGTLSPHCTSY